ncbi:MAG: aldo/keto reductase [Endomicrobiia bacterium]
MKKIKWGIIGTGSIAKKFAFDLKFSQLGELYAIASRDIKKAQEFSKEFLCEKFYGSYDGLLKDEDVEVVYISLPHVYHAEWTIKSARAGKHILCEKPLTVNYAEAEAVIYEVAKHKVFLMEAFMYRCHPQIRKLIELLNAKNRVIGDVKIIEASFGFKGWFDPDGRLFNHSLAGGGILDVGCYPVSIARLIAGVANNKLFDEPKEVIGVGKIGSTNVDEYAFGLLKFENDIIAKISCSITFWQENSVKIFGTEGSITLKNPWLAGLEGKIPSVIVVQKENNTEEIKIDTHLPLYTLEADIVNRSILENKTQPDYPAMSWQDSLGNMKTLDKWRKAIGLEYDFEKPTVYISTVDKEPLKRYEDIKMEYLKIPGLEKPVSRLILGADVHIELPYATVMFDEFYRLGGNCFDTAHIYYEGKSERVLGQWIKNRNLREEIVILDKGAHTPWCDPQNLTKQLLESLERLQVDYIDIYLLHRDNLEIPVGEFIEVLNEHKKLGRIKIFGCSNWTIQRIEEANNYARKRNLEGFSVVSNNFSLAKMVSAVWEGCISSSNKEDIEWFKKTQIPLFSWSSQARGFFSGKASPDNFEDKELVRCWYSKENFERLERARILASKKNIKPINIALAYVLSQKFPTAALIGPRNLFELKDCMVAFDIKLTEEEIRYLEEG